MDTSLYIGLGLQLLHETVIVWIDASLSRKIIEGISSQVFILFEWY
jgi:hypothetical protein